MTTMIAMIVAKTIHAATRLRPKNERCSTDYELSNRAGQRGDMAAETKHRKRESIHECMDGESDSVAVTPIAIDTATGVSAETAVVILMAVTFRRINSADDAGRPLDRIEDSSDGGDGVEREGYVTERSLDAQRQKR